jgi:sugar phosphate isomerase/epimerase
MRKRSFISIVLLAAITGLILTASYSFKKTPQKYIGLQLYSLRDSITKDVPGTIARVAKMGYKFVEPAGYSNGKFYGLDPLAFKAACKANKLTVLSSHTGQNAPTDAASKAKTMEWWDACIAAHVAVGAKYIVQPSMGPTAYKSLEGLKAYCDYFNEVGAKCNAKGIRFGYHNHDKEFSTKLDGQTMYDYMLKNTDPKKVMFEIDLYWAVVGGGNPVDYFNKYPGRFELWHIKDKEEIGASGMMDFAAIWKGAKISGMKYGIVEVERYNFPNFVSCQKSIDFLNAADYVVMPKSK